MTTIREVEVDATLHATLDIGLEMSPQHCSAAACWFQHFGGCRVGIPSAPPEQGVEGEPTSLASGQWRRQEENQKAWDTLL